MLLATSLTLSGCVEHNAPEDNTSMPTPTPTHIDTVADTVADVSTPTPTPTNATDTDDKSKWDVCDPRHNASWLYAHGCLGGGGGGGRHYHRSSVNDPVPEMPTIVMVTVGIVGLAVFYWRKR